MISLPALDTKWLGRILGAGVGKGPVLPVTSPSSAAGSPGWTPPTSPSGVTDTVHLPADTWSAKMEGGEAPRSVYVPVAGRRW